MIIVDLLVPADDSFDDLDRLLEDIQDEDLQGDIMQDADGDGGGDVTTFEEDEEDDDAFQEEKEEQQQGADDDCRSEGGKHHQRAAAAGVVTAAGCPSATHQSQPGSSLQTLDPLMLALQQEGLAMHTCRHDKIVAHDNVVAQQAQQQVSASAGERQLYVRRAVLQRIRPQTAADANRSRECLVETAAAAQRLDAAAEAASRMGCAAVASLAAWQGVHVVVMAQQLLHLPPQEQKELLRQYAAAMQDDAPTATAQVEASAERRR
eukprot:gene7622-7824_t